MTRRVEVPIPSGGWEHPWPNAFEVAAALPTERWTLIGGLMVQAHAILHGIPLIRPTDDLDVLLHIEMVPGLPGVANAAMEKLGYVLRGSMERKSHVYRYERARHGQLGEEYDVIDMMAPDHLGPKSQPRLRNHPMFHVTGGKQALSRLMTLALTTEAGAVIELKLPDELGALVLKGAAHMSDTTPQRDRHLSDAATLAACITDHAAERARLKGSDGKRLRHLAQHLADLRNPAWLRLPEPHRTAGQDTLRILST